MKRLLFAAAFAAAPAGVVVERRHAHQRADGASAHGAQLAEFRQQLVNCFRDYATNNGWRGLWPCQTSLAEKPNVARVQDVVVRLTTGTTHERNLLTSDRVVSKLTVLNVHPFSGK